MLKLYNILIDKKLIKGVGPLMQKLPSDKVQATLYREAKFYFEVYTRNYVLTVSTDWLSFNPDKKDASTDEYEKFKEVWLKLWNDLEVAGGALL